MHQTSGFASPETAIGLGVAAPKPSGGGGPVLR